MISQFGIHCRGRPTDAVPDLETCGINTLVIVGLVAGIGAPKRLVTGIGGRLTIWRLVLLLSCIADDADSCRRLGLKTVPAVHGTVRWRTDL